jgi:hypothetical protein
MPSEQIPEPWRSFLSEVDKNLKEKLELHCLLDVLRDRYEKELRPILGNPDREYLTLQLWREAIEEERNRRQL